MAGLFDGLFGGGDPSPGGGGLMGLYANPQTAGLLGMAGGLLQASGPSRLPVSNGQAFGMGLQGMGQGFGNALQMQRQMIGMQALNSMLGGSSTGGQAQPTAPSYSSLFGPSSTAPAAMPAMPAVQPQGATQSGPSIYGKNPQELFRQGMMMNVAGIPGGGDLMKIAVDHDPTLAAQMPTDLTKMGAQGGMTPDEIQAANRAGVTKANYIAPTALRTPIYFDPQSGTTKVVPADQLAAGYGAQYGAEARAQANYKPVQVWDPAANGGKGGFVFQSTTNVADAANGNGAAAQPAVPVGIRNNNFGNIKGQDGQFATYDTPQDGVNAADQLLATYGSKHGINTIAGIANRWAPAGDGNNNPVAKAAAMSAASGVPANQPINLADPATRARILPALFDTETPGWRNAMNGGGVPAQTVPASGPMAAQPPLGTTKAADAAQGAPSKQMADAYGALSNADSNYQSSREALQTMLGIANKNAPGDVVARMLPQEWATRLSNDAAEYEKAHSRFIALQGQALGAGGTDASRANQAASVPDFTKPQEAKIQGLSAQLQQLDMGHLKTQFLQPIYQAGDEKAFSKANAGFDQNIKPAMMPVLQMSGPQQRAAVQAAIKQNPALRPSFEWAFNNGLLK